MSDSIRIIPFSQHSTFQFKHSFIVEHFGVVICFVKVSLSFHYFSVKWIQPTIDTSVSFPKLLFVKFQQPEFSIQAVWICHYFFIDALKEVETFPSDFPPNQS